MESNFNLAYTFNKDTGVVKSPFSSGFIDSEEVDFLYPIDPFTGRRSDAIQQLLQADSVAEQQSILQRDDMQVIRDAPRPSGLSDDDLLALLKPRYVDSLTENSSFAHYVQSIVEQGIVKPEDTALTESAPVESAPTESQSVES